MRRSFRWLLAAAVLVTLLSVAYAPPAAGAAGTKARVTISSFVVVAPASSPVAGVTTSQLSAIFLKSSTRWPGGGEAAPVDQPADSPVRAGFSFAVHGRPTADIVGYWEQSLASGIAPPPQVADDAAVFAFLGNHPHGVGYVSGETALPPEVKVLPLLD